jgi:SRSO17 transposase
MKPRKLQKIRKELEAFLLELTQDMGRSERRRWAAVYVRGLLLDGQRKSIEPMAKRLQAIEQAGGDFEQSLQQMVNQSRWPDHPTRGRLATHLVEKFGDEATLIVDDTGFPKKGEHSVGVARQYSGTLGRVDNCQIGVTLQAVLDGQVYVLDAELYLPESWANDRKRCQRAGVPDDVGYRPKWQLALAMLQRAGQNGLRGLVVADSGYGDVTEFRTTLDERGLTYSVGISSNLTVIAANTDLGSVPRWRGLGRPPSRPDKVRAGAKATSVKQWAQTHVKAFRQVTWREGSKGKLTSRFAAWRVRPAHHLSAGRVPLPACWLLVEWPADDKEPTKYYFSSLPESMSLRRLVAAAKSRWPVEQSYQEMKDDLGLDHFEGRSFGGWHHHFTLVMLAYAFLQLYRSNHRQKKGTRKAITASSPR